jgi:hypothetical protein
MSTTYPGTGEEVRLKADANGLISVKDEAIDAELQRQLAADPDHPIKAVKGK